MTHASGIPISQELRDAFGDARSDPHTRAIQVKIVDELMVPVVRVSKQGGDREDLAALAQYALPKQPCYFLVKVTDDVTGGDSWIFVVYAPDNSVIKDRMLYASSRETCKKSLGSGYFAEDFHITEASELNWDEFQAHKHGKYVSAPLTQAEVELRQDRTAEVHVGTTKEYVHGVKFPVMQPAIDALHKLQQGGVTAVFLAVDPEKETIELHSSHAGASVANLASFVPSETPSFCIFRHNHLFEGSQTSADVFIFFCPASSRIKLKMLHASVKAPAIAGVEGVGVKISAKLEIDDPRDELSAEVLDEAIHPAARKVETRTGFAKPAMAGRGGRRPPARR